MQEPITYVGLDAHKKTISVAMLRVGDQRPLTWQLVHEPAAVRHLVRKLERGAPGPVQCCYEAGPCGYALQRQLRSARVSCQVVAPSLIPRKPGERIKTDRRDARKLAELFRAGLLTEVVPPTAADEAVRDLCRAREDAKEDLHRCRHRLSKLLLRRGIRYAGGLRAWTHAHRRWLRQLRFEHTADQQVFDDYLLAVEQLEARLRELETQVAAVAAQAPYSEPVGWLRCFRGIDTLTAVTLVAELYAFGRFQRPRALMAFLGLVPGEWSSAEDVRRGSITKTGNRHVRRLLVEAAWHYRHRPGVGPALRRRRQGQPARVIALADRAQQRLCRRFGWLILHGKPAPKAVVAVARELAGFLWVTWQGAGGASPSP